MEVPGKEQTTDKVLQVLKVSIHLKSKDYGIKSFIVCYMQNIKSDADNSFVPGLLRYTKVKLHVPLKGYCDHF